MHNTPPQKNDPPLSGGDILARIIGFLAAAAIWIALAFFLGLAGGKMAGLKEGGWNWQFMPLIVGAALGAPIVGGIVTATQVSRGRDYWVGLRHATAVIALISLPVAAGFYYFYPNK